MIYNTDSDFSILKCKCIKNITLLKLLLYRLGGRIHIIFLIVLQPKKLLPNSTLYLPAFN